MLWMQNSTTYDIRQEIKNIANGTIPNNKTAALISGLQETEKSNQDTFNILLPVFAAWITTIVAFYFHSRSHEQSQNTINKLISQTRGGLSDMTIAQIMDYYPQCRKVITVTPESSMNDVITECNQFGNVVVIGKDGHPLGILYKDDIPATSTGGNLGDNFGNITDNITNTKWTEDGVKNFANLTPEDQVSAAISKMDSIKKETPALRGLVFDKGKMIGIVNYEMLTKPLKK